jgi:ankyrin repeat protein
MPALCVAAQNGNYEVVKFLIEKGADHLRETKVTFRNILFIYNSSRLLKNEKLKMLL